MALENLLVYGIATGDNTYPHGGNFTINVAGKITVDDSDGNRDAEFGDFTDTGSSDVPDQNVTASTVSGISAGDIVDSRYTYTVTGSDGSSGNIYFIATNTTNNYGPLIVSDFPLDPSVTYTFGTFNRIGAVDYDNLVPCFTYGSMIRTADGEIPVQDLQVGQKVQTLDNGLQSIRWIDRKSLTSSDLAKNPTLLPIRIKKGALGCDLPRQDLMISPQHRVLVRSQIVKRMFNVSEVLVPAIKLVEMNGVDVVSDCDAIEYFHVLFDQHQIIYSNGAPTESLYTGPEALKAISPEARAEITTLFPHIGDPGYHPETARITPKKGKDTKQLLERHRKNEKPLLNAV